MNDYKNMTIGDLKEIIEALPDDTPIVIPVISEDDCNLIYGFRFVRTAGTLISESERERRVLCLNAANEMDIADQIYFSGKDVGVEKVLFVSYKFDKGDKS